MRRCCPPEKHISFLKKRQNMERFVMDRKTVQLGIYLRYKFNNRPGVFLAGLLALKCRYGFLPCLIT